MYDLHSPFDIQKHKETYINYLEAVYAWQPLPESYKGGNV